MDEVSIFTPPSPHSIEQAYLFCFHCSYFSDQLLYHILLCLISYLRSSLFRSGLIWFRLQISKLSNIAQDNGAFKIYVINCFRNNLKWYQFDRSPLTVGHKMLQGFLWLWFLSLCKEHELSLGWHNRNHFNSWEVVCGDSFCPWFRNISIISSDATLLLIF